MPNQIALPSRLKTTTAPAGTASVAWAPRPQAMAFLQAGLNKPPPWAPSLESPGVLVGGVSLEPPGSFARRFVSTGR